MVRFFKVVLDFREKREKKGCAFVKKQQIVVYIHPSVVFLQHLLLLFFYNILLYIYTPALFFYNKKSKNKLKKSKKKLVFFKNTCIIVYKLSNCLTCFKRYALQCSTTLIYFIACTIMQNTTLITATNSATNSNKLFTYAGISEHPDAKIGYEIRFANSAQRFAKDLGRYGHTNVRGVALSKASTKLEAAEELLQNEHFADELAQQIIQRFIAKHSTKALITA